jgi:phosphoserine aminotransferase
VVARVPAGLDRGLDDVGGRGEVGLAGTEADDRLAGGLERLGLGVHRQGRRLGDGGDACGDAVGLGGRHRARSLGLDRSAIVARDEPRHPPDHHPRRLLPSDGRFGCGPSKVRPEALAALVEVGGDLMGTSHRQARCFAVGGLRNGLAELFALPDGYEVMLGNGGTTAFWDAACFGLIEERSQHLVFGEFSSKFAQGVAAAPTSDEPEVISIGPGTRPEATASAGIDAYCLTHNETSTGVAMPLVRPEGADDGALVLVDATSAAGGLRFDASQTDVYYFAPQKCLASDGGLWLAAVSPAAVERIERLAASDRWIPAVARPHHRAREQPQGPDLQHAGPGHGVPGRAAGRLDQPERRPPLGGLPLRPLRRGHLRLGRGVGLRHPVRGRPRRPQPRGRHHRPRRAVDATTISNVLRANGIVDTESYRKLGRNQLRIALYPAIEPDDVVALTRCIDHVVEALGS